MVAEAAVGMPVPPVAVVLAAGLGKRMCSDRLKVLHAVGGRPMVLRVLTAARDAGLRQAVVVTGHQADALRAVVGAAAEQLRPLEVRYAHQREQRGTGHAVLQAVPAAGDVSHLLVLAGDAPLVDPRELMTLMQLHERDAAAATLLTARLADPSGYGRILRDAVGAVQAIVEEADATPEQRAVDEIFTLIGCFRTDPLVAALQRCRPTNAQSEIYLPDAIARFVAEGRRVVTLVAADAGAVLGINDRRALARAEAALRIRTLDRLMEQGVTILDPATTYVTDDCALGRDTVIQPMTIIDGGSCIGPRCILGPGAQIHACRIGADTRLWQSVVEDCDIGDRCAIGPYSHLRAGTTVATGVVVGNFAEIKNARLGAGTKQHHHSYIGDADIGQGVNVGAGVITVNYDGVRKHRTAVGDGAFLGCNANLVAPVEVGTGACVAAGSTVTRNVPPGDLAIARTLQRNKAGWWTERLRRAVALPASPDAHAGPAGDVAEANTQVDRVQP